MPESAYPTHTLRISAPSPALPALGDASGWPTVRLLRNAVELARTMAPYDPAVQAALDELGIARGCADLASAAETALDLLTELYPTLRPTETTRDAAIWVACERLRTALAQVQPTDHEEATDAE